MVRQLKAPGRAVYRRRRRLVVSYSIDDAASATVTAIEDDAEGVFNAVDDEPAQVREWLPALAEAVAREASAKATRLDRSWAGGRCARRHDDAGAGGVQREDQARVLLAPATPSGGRDSERSARLTLHAKHEELEAPKMTQIDSHGRRRGRACA